MSCANFVITFCFIALACAEVPAIFFFFLLYAAPPLLLILLLPLSSSSPSLLVLLFSPCSDSLPSHFFTNCTSHAAIKPKAQRFCPVGPADQTTPYINTDGFIKQQFLYHEAAAVTDKPVPIPACYIMTF